MKIEDNFYHASNSEKTHVQHFQRLGELIQQQIQDDARRVMANLDNMAFFERNIPQWFRLHNVRLMLDEKYRKERTKAMQECTAMFGENSKDLGGSMVESMIRNKVADECMDVFPVLKSGTYEGRERLLEIIEMLRERDEKDPRPGDGGDYPGRIIEKFKEEREYKQRDLYQNKRKHFVPKQSMWTDYWPRFDELTQEGISHKEAYHRLEEEVFERHGINRYSSYESFKTQKHKRDKKKKG